MDTYVLGAVPPYSFLLGGKLVAMMACSNQVRNGFHQEAYHCTAPPDKLDPWRTALFIAALSEHPGVRVIGVDGKIGPVVGNAISQLCQGGWIASSVCSIPMTYEETNEGRGWYYSHHHHMHLSFSQPSYRKKVDALKADRLCLTPDYVLDPSQFSRSSKLYRQ